jgi:hypothetical protein
MREALISLERTRPCPICAGRMKLCKINVECEGLVFRCANCDLWQSGGNALATTAPAFLRRPRQAKIKRFSSVRRNAFVDGARVGTGLRWRR